MCSEKERRQKGRRVQAYEKRRGLRKWKVFVSKVLWLGFQSAIFSRSSRCPGGRPMGVSRSARPSNRCSRPGHVGLLLSISCFSRAGGWPAGAVKAAWCSVLSPSRLLSCASHVGYRGPHSCPYTIESCTACTFSLHNNAEFLFTGKHQSYIMLSTTYTPTYYHKSITKCLEHADGVTNTGNGARRFVDTLSSVFRPRRPPRPSSVQDRIC